MVTKTNLLFVVSTVQELKRKSARQVELDTNSTGKSYTNVTINHFDIFW